MSCGKLITRFTSGEHDIFGLSVHAFRGTDCENIGGITLSVWTQWSRL